MNDVIPKKIKDTLLTPINKKPKPKKSQEAICIYCKKKFSRKDNMERHKKTCGYKRKLCERDNVVLALEKEVENLKKMLLESKQEGETPTQEPTALIERLKKQLENKTLLCNTDKNKIRQQSRNKYKNSGLSLSCLCCGYSNHVQICHIKEIRDFDTSSKVSDINDLSNLVALCSNCHFELDKQRNPEIVGKVQIHSILIKKIARINH